MNESINQPDEADLKIRNKKRGSNSEVWSRFKKNKLAISGMIILAIIVILTLSAGFLYDYHTYCVKQNIPQRLQPPLSPGHLLGTDDMGRDVAARVLHGARYSLFISFSAVIASMLIGGFLGAVAGYYGGVIDNILMRIIDIIMAIPMTMLAIVIVAVLGPSIPNMIIALVIAQIPAFARVTRGSVLTVRDMEYIEATRALGTKDFNIIVEHIIPNVLSPIIVQIAIRTAASIANVAALSFLGLGVKSPVPEWGCMVALGRAYIRDYSYLTYVPGMAMMITILSLNLLGDGLRDALDPRLK